MTGQPPLLPVLPALPPVLPRAEGQPLPQSAGVALLSAAEVRKLLGVRARRVVRSEAGANTVELVVITALVASMAIAVGAVIRNKVTEKANDLDLNTP